LRGKKNGPRRETTPKARQRHPSRFKPRKRRHVNDPSKKRAHKKKGFAKKKKQTKAAVTVP